MKLNEYPPLHKKRFIVEGVYRLTLSIDGRQSSIPFFGKNSYALLGAKVVRLGLIDELHGEMFGFTFTGGYMNRIILVGTQTPYLWVEVEYFDLPHPACSEKFSFEEYDLL